MSKLLKVKSFDYYNLLENQMKYLSVILTVAGIIIVYFEEDKKYKLLIAFFSILSIIFGLFLTNYYNNKKKFSESMYKTWIDEHPNESALRFVLYCNNVDLGFVNFTLKIDSYNGQKNYQYNFLAKETEFYFKEGDYKITIISNPYKDQEFDFHVGYDDLQTRRWISTNLEYK